MSIIVNNISYIHPDREVLFQNISFSVSKGVKASLIGNNGSGKSTLLNIIAGNLAASEGEISVSDKPYFVPQHFGQYNNLTVAQAIGVDKKIDALHAILSGNAHEENYTLLNDDWNIEERVLIALAEWDLKYVQLTRQMGTLSGGEKTKIFLAGMYIHSPSIILMDEPTNHLDRKSRQRLYDFLDKSKAVILVVSHDRTLLNFLNLTYELKKDAVIAYGGNYEFYKAQKENLINAMQSQMEEKEKALRVAKKIAREASERKQKQDSRGKKSAVKEGIPRIMMKTLKDSAENSTAKLKDIHSEKIEEITTGLKEIRQNLSENKEIKITFDNSKHHKGKMLLKAENMNFKYADDMLWSYPLNFEIKSGDRFVINGNNGSGKTTLIKLLLNKLQPSAGEIIRTDFKHIFIDQEYSIIDNNLSIFGQIEKFNSRNLPEHDLKTLLHRFLFSANVWDKLCGKLSGGEKMKLLFCCLIVSNNTPDVFILDEPTNNLDIKSLDIVTTAIKEYEGTLLVISHDKYFTEQIGAYKYIDLE